MTYQRLEFSSFRVGVRAEQIASACEWNDAECSLAPSAAVIAMLLDVAKYSEGESQIRDTLNFESFGR